MAIGSNAHPATGGTRSRLDRPSQRLHATILTSPAEILSLSPFVSTLAAEPGMLAPRFFLASLLSEPCRPCVVVVAEGKRVAGLVYCTERTVMGIPTGIVIADDTLGAMVAARPEDVEAVLRCALAALLKRRTALRWRIATERLPLLQHESAAARADVYFRPGEHHAHLPLPKTYDEFLAGVRRYTRHNLCRYRRRSELAGNEFCPILDFPAFCAAAERLHPQSAYAEARPGLQRSLAMIGEMPSRLLFGLRRSTGEWISLAGLWTAGDRAFMALQLNDRSRVRESVSLVLRSSLIEHLIRHGFRELIFLDGVSEPLSFYTERRTEFVAYIDSRSLPWLLVRHGCIALAKLAPSTFANWQAWRPSNPAALTEP